MAGTVVAVSRSPSHTLSKPNEAAIRLIAGLGVAHKRLNKGIITC